MQNMNSLYSFSEKSLDRFPCSYYVLCKITRWIDGECVVPKPIWDIWIFFDIEKDHFRCRAESGRKHFLNGDKQRVFYAAENKVSRKDFREWFGSARGIYWNLVLNFLIRRDWVGLMPEKNYTKCLPEILDICNIWICRGYTPYIFC